MIRLLSVLLLALSAQAQQIYSLPQSQVFWQGKPYSLSIVAYDLHNGDCVNACGAMTNCVERWIRIGQNEDAADVKSYVWHELGHVVSECNSGRIETLHKSIYRLEPMRDLLMDKRNRLLAKWLLGF